MQRTRFFVAAKCVLAIGIAFGIPWRSAAPGLAMVAAQAPKAAPAAPPAKQGGDDRPAALRIEHELGKSTTLEVVEAPLKDVVSYLQDVHNIPIVIKTKKLEEMGVALDAPVTKNLRGVRLSSALNLILEDLDLTYVVKDEVLQITTPHDAQSVMEIRIYDCRDLLQMPAGLGIKEQPPLPGTGGGEPMAVSDHSERAARLMNIISTNVDWHSWVKNLGAMGGMGMGGMAMPGGRGEQELKRRGSISEYNGLIVVTQTAQTHKKIEHVLDMLRQAAELPAAGAGKVIR